MRDYPDFIVPHSDHGDVECCGLIMIEVRSDKADLRCNECGVILKTVSAAAAEQVLKENGGGTAFMRGAMPILRTDKHIYALHRNEGLHLSRLRSRCRQRRRGIPPAG
jgi:hypothetical protein